MDEHILIHCQKCSFFACFSAGMIVESFKLPAIRLLQYSWIILQAAILRRIMTLTPQAHASWVLLLAMILPTLEVLFAGCTCSLAAPAWGLVEHGWNYLRIPSGPRRHLHSLAREGLMALGDRTVGEGTSWSFCFQVGSPAAPYTPCLCRLCPATGGRSSPPSLLQAAFLCSQPTPALPA